MQKVILCRMPLKSTRCWKIEGSVGRRFRNAGWSDCRRGGETTTWKFASASGMSSDDDRIVQPLTCSLSVYDIFAPKDVTPIFSVLAKMEFNFFFRCISRAESFYDCPWDIAITFYLCHLQGFRSRIVRPDLIFERKIILLWFASKNFLRWEHNSACKWIKNCSVLRELSAKREKPVNSLVVSVFKAVRTAGRGAVSNFGESSHFWIWTECTIAVSLLCTTQNALSSLQLFSSFICWLKSECVHIAVNSLRREGSKYCYYEMALMKEHFEING